MKRWAVGLLLSAGVVVSDPAAAADPDATMSGHMRRGDAARDAGRCADAVTFYRSALEEASRARVGQKERAAVAGELGLCELKIGRFRDAAEHLRMSVGDLASLPPWRQTKLTEAYARAAREVTMVTIAVRPSDAEVLIDDQSIGSGKGNYLVFLEPGQHTARARLSKHHDVVLRLTAVKGAAQGFDLVVRAPEEPEPKPAAPLRPVAPAPAPVPVDDDKAPAATLRRVCYVTAGAGAALGAGLLISAAVVNGKLNDKAHGLAAKQGFGGCKAGSAAPECTDLEDAKGARDVLHGIGVTSLILGGVAGGVALGSFLWESSESPSRVQVAPSVGTEQASVHVTAVW